MRGINKPLGLFSQPSKGRRNLNMSTPSHWISRALSQPHEPSNDLFGYTSGRWLYNEQIQLRKRYTEFNIQALECSASRLLGTRCIQITKLPEGLYNKVHSASYSAVSRDFPTCLMHHDLHFDNIFVDAADPTAISSIIDWQAVYAAPLFLQARFPSIFECDDPYPWGAVQPQLPNNFQSLSLEERETAKEALARLRLKKFYELASRKFNPLLVRAMDAMMDDNDPTAYIFHSRKKKLQKDDSRHKNGQMHTTSLKACEYNLQVKMVGFRTTIMRKPCTDLKLTKPI
ncbi:hypothetical protein P175DRAFT_0555424 [Aspergillus ochraceoroseus IBT 24754]|uniref:Altered inheritance of mitochondria protein 9, mitochondrial n=1 Tax=Aspergillus ochraceoroseus IBT 24754 TaxID=1392256 RepID=A0A2T5M2J9_9EURO|nr:uncharacterized protein P175DRAFT_0555424 [Aspergillus ochraceoroseus IBT 24754]PTU22758.1 hypothetical protein P175DRAFT_0555424 [Aspergillus ochraceoroseus IBT 24754]